MAVDRILNMAATLFWSALLARALTKSDFGIYNFTIALVGMFMPLASFGLNAQLNKLFLSKSYPPLRVLTAAIAIRVGAALFSLLCIFAYTRAALEGENDYNIMLYASVLVFQSLQVYESLLQSYSKSRIGAYSRIFVVFASLCIKILLFRNGYINLELAVIIQAFELSFYYLVLALFSTRLVVPELMDSAPIDQKSYGVLFPYMAKSGVLLIISGTAEAINLRIDQIMIEHYLGVEAVAEYAAASRISESVYFFAAAIAASFFPGLMKAKKHSPSTYDAALLRLNAMLVGLAFIFIVGFALLGKIAIKLLYGDGYQSSYGVLLIHMLAGVFIFSRAVFSKWIVIEDLLQFSIYTHALGAITNVSLNVYFIPVHGIHGAAIATVVSYSIASYFSLFLFKKTRPFVRIITPGFAMSKGELE